jgi:uncharacterized protein YcfJ
MKRLALVCLIASGFGAAQADTFFDNARVRSAEPQYETVNVPRNECSTSWVNETRPANAAGPNYGGVIVGGVAGAVLGNQVGKGHGREAATAVGAVVGALAGDRIANQQRDAYQVVPREVTSCHTVNDVQTRLTGYRVNYDYRGQHYTTFMRDNPGPSLQVRVSVEPVAQ